MTADTIDLLLPYQKEYITDSLSSYVKEFVIVEKSRRVGFTFAEACWSVRRRLVLKEHHYFSSADERTSKEFIQYCVLWSRIFNLYLPPGQQIDVSKASSECLEMPNGSKIVAVSSNPRALRGKGGSVTLDEFAFHEDQERLFTAAQAVVQWGGHLHIISTHNGPATFFAELCKRAQNPPTQGFSAGRKIWRHQRVTIYDAVKQGLAKKMPGDHHRFYPDNKKAEEALIESIKATCSSDEAFQQEFCCKPLKLAALISAEEYDAVTMEAVPYELDMTRKYNSLSVGIDVGRVKDLTVVWVIEHGIDPTANSEQLKHVYRTVCILAMRNTDFPTQLERIKAILSHPAIERCLIDMGSVGRQLADDLQAEYGDIVTPVGITGPRKAQLCELLKKYVQYQLISMPPDNEIKEDVCSMSRVATAKGNLSYEGSTTFSHCDYFLGAALACMSAEASGGIAFASKEDHFKAA